MGFVPKFDCICRYYPDPLPGLPTLSSEPGSRSSHGRNKAIIGGVVGGIIGFLALVVPTIVMICRRSRSAKQGEVGKPQLDLLTPRDRAIVGQDGEGLTQTPAEKSENAATTKWQYQRFFKTSLKETPSQSSSLRLPSHHRAKVQNHCLLHPPRKSHCLPNLPLWDLTCPGHRSFHLNSSAWSKS